MGVVAAECASDHHVIQLNASINVLQHQGASLALVEDVQRAYFRRLVEAKAALWTPRAALVSSCMIGFHG